MNTSSAGGTQLMARVTLGRALRRLREDGNLTLSQVAQELGYDDSLISRVESGKKPCSQQLFDRLMGHYLVEPDERAELADVLTRSRDSRRAWWAKYREVISVSYARFLEFEDAACRVFEYQVSILPGLLQTEAYARAVTSAGFIALGPDQVDGLVEVRMLRQQHRLDADPPLECRYVITQAALEFVVGGRDVHLEQLQHLLTVSTRKEVDLRVIPFERGAEGSQISAYTLFQFPNTDVPDLGFGESVVGSGIVDDPRDLRRLHRLHSSLGESALDPKQTRALIEKIHERNREE